MKIPDSLLLVAQRLGDLRDRVVFVGGMIRPLLVTDPAIAGARPTDDVDLIVDVSSAVSYYALNQSLRNRDFHEAHEEGAPICRWMVEGVRVDVMPVDPAILGFSNVWYFGAHEASLTVGTADCPIRFLDAPHFCASKLESFFNRGEGDLFHHDLEDLIAIVDGRPTLIQEIAASSKDLRDFLAEEIARLLAREDFVEALPGHLAGDEASQGRLPLILDRLRAIAALIETPKPSRQGLMAPPPPGAIPARHGKSGTEPFRPSRETTPSSAPRIDLQHIFSHSSNLYGASYDANTLTLLIQFRNGSLYSYSAVPATIYAGLLGARSAGRYHHQWIRLRYPYRRL